MNQIKNSGHYYSGLSGLQLPVPKYLFPPEHQSSSRLTYYTTFYNSIEFNSSFYKVPMSRTVTKWSAAVPDNFKFTFKLWNQITHAKGLLFEEEDVAKFIQTISHVDDKKGCLLVQFPPSLKNEKINQLAKLLKSIKEVDAKKTWNVAVEFRNRTWYNDDVYSLLDHYKTALVIQDKPASLSPLKTLRTKFVYLRFHGPTGNYRGSYSNDVLTEYAEYIKEWLSERKTVYAYFNNTMGDAFNNLKTLNSFII